MQIKSRSTNNTKIKIMKKELTKSVLTVLMITCISCNGSSLLNGDNGNLVNDIASGILSSFGSNTSESTIVGTWVYKEPAVQFESNNMLAQIGSGIANSTVEKKLKTYYEKLGIKSGVFAFTFNADKTCSYTLKNKTYTGTYEFDDSSDKIRITTNGIISFPSAYAKVTGNQLELTFETTSLLNLGTSLASGSGNSTLGAISEIAQTYSGMKTGFNFIKK